MPSDRVRCPRCKLLSVTFRSTREAREYRCKTCGLEFDDPRRLRRERLAREQEARERREAFEAVERLATGLLSKAKEGLAAAIGAVLRQAEKDQGAGQASVSERSEAPRAVQSRFLAACGLVDMPGSRSLLIDLARTASIAQRAEGQARLLRAKVQALGEQQAETGKVLSLIENIPYERPPHPTTLGAVVGQTAAVERLRALLDSQTAGAFGPHVVICGPPSSGRAALANAYAVEVACKPGKGLVVSGDAHVSTGQWAGMLFGPKAALVVRELGELTPENASRLLEATFQHELSITTGEGSFESQVKLPIEPFALVAVVSSLDDLPDALRGVDCISMAPYTDAEIREILTKDAERSHSAAPAPLLDEALAIGRGDLSIATAVLWLASRA